MGTPSIRNSVVGSRPFLAKVCRAPLGSRRKTWTFSLRPLATLILLSHTYFTPFFYTVIRKIAFIVLIPHRIRLTLALAGCLCRGSEDSSNLVMTWRQRRREKRRLLKNVVSWP